MIIVAASSALLPVASVVVVAARSLIRPLRIRSELRPSSENACTTVCTVSATA